MWPHQASCWMRRLSPHSRADNISITMSTWAVTWGRPSGSVLPMKTVRAAALLTVTLLGFSACASGAPTREYVSTEDSAASSSVSAGRAGAPMEISDGEYDSAEDAGDIEREIITNGSLTLVTDDVTQAIDDVLKATDEVGGWVQSQYHSNQSKSQYENAWVTLRVPANKLDPLITAVEDFGEVRELHVSTDDVTRYGRDLDARISALEASTERLLELMSEADSSEALIAAETALSERQGELEALRSERRYLSDQVAMSTLEVYFQPTETAEFDRGGFLGGISKGWNALVNSASALLIALGALVPWVLTIGIPVTAIIWLLRRRRHKRGSASSRPSKTPEDVDG